ncbi:MAG: hypothetical protein MJH11_00975, partial [Lentisphaeria bacterium]|nr:hypothetical protein [Lentisphaeria bacterium]
MKKIIQLYLLLFLGTAFADEALIKLLGSDNYKERRKAGKALIKGGRKLCPLLQKNFSNEDPEISERCKTIWAKILEDPKTLPPRYYNITVRDSNTYKTAYEAWAKKTTYSVTHTDPNKTSNGNYMLAQSFTAKDKTLKGIELMLHNNGGWVQASIHDDKEGRPGKLILGRCHLRMTNSSIDGNNFIIFPFDSIQTKVSRKYWMVITSVRRNYLSLGV